MSLSATTASSGSIPARAGEPDSAVAPAKPPRVYPRTCGGTRPSRIRFQALRGLSPHVRGNLLTASLRTVPGGSIPARAGEPAANGWCSGPSGVYPRTCGGTEATGRRATGRRGLSPHVRGNPGRLIGVKSGMGSIPARAGEPGAAASSIMIAGVYPRTCGGTLLHRLNGQILEGLSPHVRGNLGPLSG